MSFRKLLGGGPHLGNPCRDPGEGSGAGSGGTLQASSLEVGLLWREPVFRLEFVGFGDKGPVCGEQCRGGLWDREEEVKTGTGRRWGYLGALLGY